MLREVLHNFAELGHALRFLSSLVVGDSQLNVTEDEAVVEFHRTSVIVHRLVVLVEDK